MRRRGSFHFGLGYNGSLNSLTDAIKAIPRRRGVDSSPAIAALGVFCLAGADIPIDDRRIAAELERQGWTRKTIVRNDTFAVLRAGTDRKWGVAVVCGTGMNCAGVGPDGRSVRFPSFGELSGDRAHGGGWLGRSALGAAIRARDGRGRGPPPRGLGPAFSAFSARPGGLKAGAVGRLDPGASTDPSPPPFHARA